MTDRVVEQKSDRPELTEAAIIVSGGRGVASAENVSVSEGLAGTWPSQLPSLFGAQIDHVLTANGPKARSVEFLDVPGTDHRAVLAEISR